MKNRDLRTGSLIGEAGLERLKRSTVAVIGLGGVGSFAAEALARSGIGTLYLYDKDIIAESNLNRQLFAALQTVGVPKTLAAAERIQSIRPETTVITQNEFLTPQSVLPWAQFDAVIDAVDNITLKIHLAVTAAATGTPIVGVMGTGNKLHPELLRISDIFETDICPLCRVMRRELARRNVSALRCVWSTEKPLTPTVESGTRENGRPNPGSMIFVPAAAGLLAASDVVNRLLQKNDF